MDTANILVVEDDADINRLLCTILEGAGYTCRSAFSGSEALLWAEKYDYDLIVLDLMLPGVTGEELIARIRRGGTMPIIVASAKVGVSDRVNVLRLGADDFIPKPFDNAEVLARVEAQLRRSRQFAAPKADVLTAGPLTLDRDSHTAAGKSPPGLLQGPDLRGGVGGGLHWGREYGECPREQPALQAGQGGPGDGLYQDRVGDWV